MSWGAKSSLSCRRHPLCIDDRHSAYQIGTIGAPITEIKTKLLADGTIALVFNAAADPEGKLLNPEEQPKPRTTAREFETVNVRYWADWTDSYRKSLFYTTMEKDAESGRYKLPKDPPVNALLGTDINYPWTHHAPFGEGGEYNVSVTGIVFTALDPSNSLAEATILTKVWYIPLTTFRESPAPQLRMVEPSPDVTFDGSAENLVFSPDGKKIAFTVFSDKSKFIYCPRRVLVASIEDGCNARYVKILDPSLDNEKDWDYWGGSLLWSNDGCALYYTVGFHACTNIYRIPVGADIRADIAVRPEELTSSGSVTAAFRLGQEDSALLLTMSSFIDSSTYVKLSLSSKEQHVLSSATQAGNLFGISAKQVTQLTVPVAHYKVQAWLITPPDMDKTKKYPLVVSVHGGPQVALPDSWSTRWNPLLSASQGYVVLIPNYSGSSTFGQEFEDSVGEGWGARPYDDVMACFEYVEQNCPFVDTSRSVAMGGSFGGYFMNWMAGQPLGAKMKALVCHNGIWNLAGMYASDSPVGLRIEFNGALWENRKHWEKYDPALFVQNWKTPMLFIHSDNDFRYVNRRSQSSYRLAN